MLYCKKALHGVWVGLLKLQVVIMVASFLICVTCMFIEVVFRYILEIQVFGFEDLASAVCIWLYLIGAAYGTHKGSHLKAELVHLILKTPRTKAIASVMVSLISLGLAGYLLTWGYDYFIFNLTVPRFCRIGGVIGDFPMVYSQSAIFFGFILIVFYFLVESIKNIRAVFQK